MSKDIYILIGLPGVGKTTWVEKEFQGSCHVISSDNILEAIAQGLGDTYDGVFSKFIKVADKMMWQDFDRAIYDDNHPIIVDRTNMSIKSRRRIFERLKSFKVNHGYNVHAVVFPKPEDSEYERRLNSRPGKTIPRNVINSMTESFQMPTESEGFSTIKVVET